VLARLATEVVGVEQAPALAEQARDNLAALGIGNVQMVNAPLIEGAPQHGPYDVIVVEIAMERVPEALQAQLADGGRLVAVIGGAGTVTVANLFVRSGDDVAARAEFDASMPPLLTQRGAEPFVF
jgi:protein-L-isoaspartate(D-aspartate) O-methyltransferase